MLVSLPLSEDIGITVLFIAIVTWFNSCKQETEKDNTTGMQKSNSNLIKALKGKKPSIFDYPNSLNRADKTFKRFSVNTVQKRLI